jgi:hypothetical protein
MSHYIRVHSTGDCITIGPQHCGLTMINVCIGRAGSHVYDLTAADCRELARALLAEANRQEQAKSDDEKLRAALAADEMSDVREAA